MKKNKMMSAASALLIAGLLTTCAVSGTFAKYTTSETGSDTARVAKWGVEVTAEGTMFADAYATDDTKITTITNSVVSAGMVKDIKEVVAPGTEGTMAAVKIIGKPEVAVEVTYKATEIEFEGWTVEDNTYCPIIITISGKNGVIATLKGTDYTDINAFEDEIARFIGEYSQIYEANTDLSLMYADTSEDDLVVSWEWPYSTSDDNDKKDTELGDQAAKINPATIKIAIETTVTQID